MRQRERWGLVAVVLGGTILRFWGLGGQSLWYDEWSTSEAVSGSLGDLVRYVANREGLPPTYFLLQWGWVQVAGDGEVALRALSALFGVATIPVAYWIAIELRQRRAVALAAATLVAVNPMLLWYSQEARSYSLAACFGALSFLMFVRVWNDGRREDLVAWAVVAACTVAMHYFAAFLIAVEVAALLLRRSEARRRVLLAIVPSLAVLGLLAPFALKQHSHDANRLWISGFSLRTRLSEAGRSALVGPGAPHERLWLLVALVVVVAAVLVVMRADESDRRAVALCAAVAGSAVALPILLAVLGIEDVVIGRYLVPSLVPLIVAVAIGLSQVRRWILVPAVGLVSVVSLGVFVSVQREPEIQKPDWRSVAAMVEANGPGDSVVVVNLQGVMGRPLLRYVDDAERLAHDGVARVSEVYVIYATAGRASCNYLVGQACGFVFLGAPPPSPVADRLELVERVELDQFDVERYRVDGDPIEVTKRDLVAPEQVDEALVVVTPGSRNP